MPLYIMVFLNLAMIDLHLRELGAIRIVHKVESVTSRGLNSHYLIVLFVLKY